VPYTAYHEPTAAALVRTSQVAAAIASRRELHAPATPKKRPTPENINER